MQRFKTKAKNTTKNGSLRDSEYIIIITITVSLTDLVHAQVVCLFFKKKEKEKKKKEEEENNNSKNKHGSLRESDYIIITITVAQTFNLVYAEVKKKVHTKSKSLRDSEYIMITITDSLPSHLEPVWINNSKN